MNDGQMKKAGEIISQTQRTKPSMQSTLTYAHSEETFDYVWRGLQAGRFLTKTMIIGGTDYLYWRSNLKDLNDKRLLAGFKHTSTFSGYLTWSEFRKLCIEGYNQENQQSRQYTTARLSDPSTLGNERFQELMKVTNAMSAEVGEGPITIATRAGKLDLYFIRGKSAGEIINYCNKLYFGQAQATDE